MNDVTSPPKPAPRTFDVSIVTAPSGRLRFTAGYFGLGGVLAGASLVANLIFSVVSTPSSPGSWWAMMGVLAATTSSYLWTARELRRQSVAGWHAAVFTLAAPLVGAIMGQPIGMSALVTSVVGLALVVSVRDELT